MDSTPLVFRRLGAGSVPSSVCCAAPADPLVNFRRSVEKYYNGLHCQEVALPVVKFPCSEGSSFELVSVTVLWSVTDTRNNAEASLCPLYGVVFAFVTAKRG